MKITNLIKTKAAVAAMVMGTLGGAFFMPATYALASDGDGAVYVEVPQGWQNQPRTLQVKVDDYVKLDKNSKEMTVSYTKVYFAFDEDTYSEITDSMVVTIDHNCKLKLKAFYDDGNVVFNEIDINNFDLELPTINAVLEGEIMYFEATDAISGVADICVNGKAFSELTEGKMCVNVKDLECTDEYICIHSDDKAGNASKEFKLKNPYYVGPIESGQQDESLNNPDSVEATDPTEARGTVTDDFVTADREFFTVDASGKTFYLIVDRTESNENVYLLTEAGVNDLLNFTDYNGVDVQNGDVPMYEIPSNAKKDTEEEEIPEVVEEEAADTTEKPKNNSATTVVVVLLVCAAGGGYYFYKNKKRKEDYDDAEEMDAFDVPDDFIKVDSGEVEIEGDEEPDADENNGPEFEINDFDEEVPNDDKTAKRYMAYLGKLKKDSDAE